MAKQESPITTRTLAHGPAGVPPPPEFPTDPPRPLDPPVPGFKPARAKGGSTEYRVMVRHSPLTWYKSLVVKADDEAGAWEEFQAEVAERLTAGHLTPEQNKSGRRVLSTFQLWISQQPPGRIPAEVTIQTEADYQDARRKYRESLPRGVATQAK